MAWLKRSKSHRKKTDLPPIQLVSTSKQQISTLYITHMLFLALARCWLWSNLGSQDIKFGRIWDRRGQRGSGIDFFIDFWIGSDRIFRPSLKNIFKFTCAEVFGSQCLFRMIKVKESNSKVRIGHGWWDDRVWGKFLCLISFKLSTNYLEHGRKIPAAIDILKNDLWVFGK